jgi:SNF2 family DNA or RNA helicase
LDEIDLYETQQPSELYDRKLAKMWSEIELINGDKLYINEFSGEFREKMILFKESKGGIVADEMGLGKTI